MKEKNGPSALELDASSPETSSTAEDVQRHWQGVVKRRSFYHFGLWHDKGRNAVSQPLAGVVDPVTGLTFPDLNNPATELTQTNKILPEPCNFISKSLPRCSVIRPTSTQLGGAVATVKPFIADGMFIGQPDEFFDLSMKLAVAADSAVRGF